MEESAAASHALEDQAGDLTRQIAFFKVRDGKTVTSEVDAVLSRAARASEESAAPSQDVAGPRMPAAAQKAARATPVRAEARGKSEDAVWEEF